MNTTHRRVAAVVAAVALSAPVAGTAALAAAPPAAATPVVAAAQVSSSATGSVTVTALVNGAANTTRRPGVVFTLRRVEGVDLTTSAGWTQALAYLDPGAAPTPTLGPALTLPATDTEGVATIGDVPVGLYLLSADGWVDVYLTLPAGPDSLAGPPSGAAGDSYAVAVYPKHAPPPTTPTTPAVPTGPGSSAPASTGPGETTTGGTSTTTTTTATTTTTTTGTGTGTNKGQQSAAPGQGGAQGGRESGSGGQAGVAQPVQTGQPGRLPYTGAEIALPITIALGAIVAGAVLLIITRRRRTDRATD